MSLITSMDCVCCNHDIREAQVHYVNWVDEVRAAAANHYFTAAEAIKNEALRLASETGCDSMVLGCTTLDPKVEQILVENGFVVEKVNHVLSSSYVLRWSLPVPVKEEAENPAETEESAKTQEQEQ